ncbi:hypothetical protein AB9F26_12305 [Falsihalocynthiibacter sp. BN13B15]|uniref:hypothetical protein n=1 Tax=Falsihalocynthiibacter sp. BN13B15 TaxID=3240871 RepID=UPI00350FE4F9
MRLTEIECAALLSLPQVPLSVFCNAVDFAVEIFPPLKGNIGNKAKTEISIASAWDKWSAQCGVKLLNDHSLPLFSVTGTS